jgi:MerR HTH family regulatory protein
MNASELIRAEEFCSQHQITISFLEMLSERGLTRLAVVQEVIYIPSDELTELERIMRLHFDLEINLEGVEVITRMLQKLNDLNEEKRILQNRLQLYEE